MAERWAEPAKIINSRGDPLERIYLAIGIYRHPLERAPQSGTLGGIEVRWTNRCDWAFASPPCAVLNRVRAAVLNLCVARTYGRIGCILRLTGKANWSFGGRVSITGLQTLI